ncbi:MAG: DUF4347 domain-containing protein, partial [Aliivibrio sp.]|uniref:DUF4347 domain-containing protein n=1 Tax=Aliivibrio sp. TaxID=1872443 RepID=UPI001A48E47F|nr:DUF4347 domain-containing protein [Aliivibrio sp.]
MKNHTLNVMTAAILPLSLQLGAMQTAGAYGYVGHRGKNIVYNSAENYVNKRAGNPLTLLAKPLSLMQATTPKDEFTLYIQASNEPALQVTSFPIGDSDLQLQISTNNPINELIIIDQAVPDKHLFYKDLKPSTAVHEIASDQDGLTQLNQILSQYQNLDALHLVSHADDGVIYLGNTQVTEQLLKEKVDTFSSLNNALKEGADLLLYGCNLAKTEKGEGLLALIAHQADIDVAASNDLTGNMRLQGDWDLEIHTGDINVSSPFSPNALKDFSAVLGTVSSGGFSGAPGLSLTTTDFTLKGYVTAVQTSLKISGGNAYINNNTSAKTSYFFIDGNDGGGYSTFSLTGVNLQEYTTNDITNVYIVGLKTAGGTISSAPINKPTQNKKDSFPFTGTELSHADWGDLTGFKIYFTTFNSSGAEGMEFVDFTVGTAVPVSGNDAPVAVADSYNVNEGALLSGATVLSNDTDAESDNLTAIKVSEPTNGSLTLNSDGTFSYTHDGSETTTDSFTYKANDGTVDSNTVTVSLT